MYMLECSRKVENSCGPRPRISYKYEKRYLDIQVYDGEVSLNGFIIIIFSKLKEFQ
jgi:hypothetical protein